MRCKSEEVTNNVKIKLDPYVVFYHIEKCAGASLQDMFYEYFQNIYLDSEIYMPYKNNWKHYNSTQKDYFEENNFKIILGHISINDKISDFSEHIKITCIRHPIDRVISHFYYFDYDNYNIPLHRMTKEQLNTYVYSRRTILFRLSGGTHNIKDTFENVKQTNIILIFEKLQDDIVTLNTLLNSHFNTNANINCKHINKMKTVVPPEQIAQDKNRLLSTKLLDKEMLIYNYICGMKDEDRFRLTVKKCKNQNYVKIPNTTPKDRNNPHARLPIVRNTTYGEVIVKPINHQYFKRGAVSSSSRLARLKYNTVSSRALYYNTARGASEASAGKYSENGKSPYFIKLKNNICNSIYFKKKSTC